MEGQPTNWENLLAKYMSNIPVSIIWDSQMTLKVKNSPASAGDVKDVGLIPGLGRSPGGGHGNPLQYSCLGNPMDRGAWWTTYSPWGPKESDTTEWLTRFPSLNMLISLLLDHMAIFLLKLGLASIKPHVQGARKKQFSQRKREHKYQGNKSNRRHGNIPVKSGQP